MRLRNLQVLALLLLIPFSVTLWLLKGQWWLQAGVVLVILGLLPYVFKSAPTWKPFYLLFVLMVTAVFSVSLLNVMRLNIANPPEWDFQAFWLAARIGSQRQNIYDPTNYAKLEESEGLIPSKYFREEIIDVGFWYPPPSIFFVIPLGWFSIKTALILWYGFHILVLILTVFRLWQMFFAEYGRAGLLIVAALVVVFEGTLRTFLVAQTGLLLLFCLLSFWKEKEPVRAGIWLALAILVKPIAGVVILYLLVRRQWRSLISAFMTFVVLLLIFIALFGVQTLLSYRISPPLPTVIYLEIDNQSLLSTILRLTHYDLTIHSPLSHPIFLAMAVILTAITVWIVYRLSDQDRSLSISLLIGLGLLLYPATLNHYAVLLIPVLLVLWGLRSLDGWRNWSVSIFITFVYAIVGYNDGSASTIAFFLCWITVAIIAFRRTMVFAESTVQPQLT